MELPADKLLPERTSQPPARSGRLAATLALACGLVAGDPTAATAQAPQPPLATEEARPVLPARPFFFALSVADVERSAAWYGLVFGFRQARAVDFAGGRIRLLARDGALLELVEAVGARALSELEPAIEKRHLLQGVFKFGFEVSDLDEAARRLEALEVPLRGPVVAEQDGSMRSAQVEDPDGNVVQLFELLGDG